MPLRDLLQEVAELFVRVMRVTACGVARTIQIVARRRLLKFLIFQKPLESR
jgi:hypothetical protein